MLGIRKILLLSVHLELWRHNVLVNTRELREVVAHLRNIHHFRSVHVRKLTRALLLEVLHLLKVLVLLCRKLLRIELLIRI